MAQARSRGNERLEDRLQVEFRAADDAQNLARCSLVFMRFRELASAFGQLPVARLQFFEQRGFALIRIDQLLF
jgi:hypothetical protein